MVPQSLPICCAFLLHHPHQVQCNSHQIIIALSIRNMWYERKKNHLKNRPMRSLKMILVKSQIQTSEDDPPTLAGVNVLTKIVIIMILFFNNFILEKIIFWSLILQYIQNIFPIKSLCSMLNRFLYVEFILLQLLNSKYFLFQLRFTKTSEQWTKGQVI